LNKITELFGINTKLIGYPIRMKLECFDSANNPSKSLKAFISQEMMKEGNFIFPSSIFVFYSHTEEC